MADIVLATLNAKFIHAAFGLRYLLANLGDLRPRTVLLEFDLQQRPVEIVERMLAHAPRIIGLGVYIWNARETTEVVSVLKRVRPEIVVVLGGPEVSYETEEQEVVRLADHVIPGEADLAFGELCRTILGGCSHGRPGVLTDQDPGGAKLRPSLAAISDWKARPEPRPTGTDSLAGTARPPQLLPPAWPELDRLRLPYDEYDERDIAHRIIYVEASRGCPFECEFCLSSLDVPVRQFPLERFLAAMDGLLARGARQFKFVDRTFNLNHRVSGAILDFFLARLTAGLFLHFEVVPDRLPSALRERLARFPSGMVQLEVGIQTFDPEVAERISRRQDYGRLEENLRFLREQTGVHLHADLIFGLPGETIESFGAGFDRLLALRPHEIQVGLLKRLRGTPIVRHTEACGMVYAPGAPYELLCNKLLDFATVQRVRRLARFWDLVANSGRFPRAAPLIWRGQASAFAAFLRFSDWAYERAGRHHAIALPRLAGILNDYLTGPGGLEVEEVRLAMEGDLRPGRARGDIEPMTPPRQARHQQANRVSDRGTAERNAN